MMHNDHQIVLTKKLQKRWYSVLKQFTFYISMKVMRSESQSGMCTKLPTVAASNN